MGQLRYALTLDHSTSLHASSTLNASDFVVQLRASQRHRDAVPFRQTDAIPCGESMLELCWKQQFRAGIYYGHPYLGV